jgi:hypothetical protein
MDAVCSGGNREDVHGESVFLVLPVCLLGVRWRTFAGAQISYGCGSVQKELWTISETGNSIFNFFIYVSEEERQS